MLPKKDDVALYELMNMFAQVVPRFQLFVLPYRAGIERAGASSCVKVGPSEQCCQTRSLCVGHSDIPISQCIIESIRKPLATILKLLNVALQA